MRLWGESGTGCVWIVLLALKEACCLGEWERRRGGDREEKVERERVSIIIIMAKKFVVYVCHDYRVRVECLRD